MFLTSRIWWVLVAGLSGCSDASEPDPVRVYAAASTTDAISEALAELEAAGGPVIQASFGASSTLARQLEHGAPADLFLSASPAWMDRLEQVGRVVPGTRTDLLSNQLVLVAPAGEQPLGPDLALADLLAARLAEGRLALADPDHVPAGQYARQALEALGLWEGVEDRLAPAGDVRAALAWVERGEAPLGLVYRTDALVSDRVVTLATLPADLHHPIAYPVAAVGEGDAVRSALAFLTGEQAAAVFARHGFGRP